MLRLFVYASILLCALITGIAFPAEDRGVPLGITFDWPSSKAGALRALEERVAEFNQTVGRADWAHAENPSIDLEAALQFNRALYEEMFAQGIAAILKGTGELSRVDTRKFHLLRHRTQRPLPEDPSKRAALHKALEAVATSRNKSQIADFSETGNATQRKEQWISYAGQIAAAKQPYIALVRELNSAAQQWGYSNAGVWRISMYDEPAGNLKAELRNVWKELLPLYSALQRHIGKALAQQYGKDFVPDVDRPPLYLFPTPAASDWSALFDIARGTLPLPATSTPVIQARRLSVLDLARQAEQFYLNLGFDPLPESFWQRSRFVKKEHSNTDCTRQGWNVDWVQDVRVTLCGQPREEDFLWLQRILAFLYYDLAFANQDWTFRDPPNLAFHFANAGAAGLSMTPAYMKSIGYRSENATHEEEIARQLHTALRILPRIGYLLVVEEWRSSVMAGNIRTEEWDAEWMRIRNEFGLPSAPSDWSGGGFDAAVSDEIIYDSDALSRAIGDIVQFQYYEAACGAGRHQGALHTCVVQGKDAGDKLRSVLQHGASNPWRQILKEYTGNDTISAKPMLKYFAPLRVWLDEQDARSSP